MFSPSRFPSLVPFFAFNYILFSPLSSWFTLRSICRCHQLADAVSGTNTASPCSDLALFVPSVNSLRTTRLHAASDRCTACMTSCNVVTPRDLRPRRFIDPGRAMSGGQVSNPRPPSQSKCIGCSTSLQRMKKWGNCIFQFT
jgi:hypothetical protein